MPIARISSGGSSFRWVNGVAHWDGSDWQGFSQGTPWPVQFESVEALAIYNKQLIAAGPGVLRWDGASWTSLGSDPGDGNGTIYALTVYGGNLIAAGWFYASGGGPSNNIFQWDGVSWLPVGDGIGTPVYAATTWNGDLELVTGGRTDYRSSSPYCGCWTNGTLLLVDANAAMNGTGASWADPIKDLQLALGLAANPELNIHEIWVVEGTYKLTTPAGSLPGERRCASSSLLDDVAIYGGFSGTETTRDQRDPLTHETILTNDAANSRNVIVASGVDETAVLDGFTITADSAVAPESVSEFFMDGSPTISNNKIIARGERYLDVDPDPDGSEHPVLLNNRIQVIVQLSTICGAQGGLLALRSPDVDCQGLVGQSALPGLCNWPVARYTTVRSRWTASKLKVEHTSILPTAKD